MPLSWPKRLCDNPTYLNFRSTKGRVLFGEDVFAGYRWYDAVNIAPLWSFGHGLSYTTFAMSAPKLAVDFGTDGRPHGSVTLNLHNTGVVDGAEVLQLFVSAVEPSVRRPERELHGFTKVFLAAGATSTVSVAIDPYAMSFWDESDESWCLEKGQYRVTVRGSACEDPVLSLDQTIYVEETTMWTGL